MYPMKFTGSLSNIGRQIKSARSATVGTIIIALATGLAVPSRADILWYNGNFATNSFGVLNGIDMTFEGLFPAPGVATVYDDFNVPAGTGGWHVDTLWSNNLMTFTGVSQATWSIRADLSSGDPGTLIAAGTSPATQTATGNSLLEFTEFTIQVSGLALDLAPGTYWLAVTPHGLGGPESSLNSVTDGLNAIGSPPGNNGNAFLNSPLLAADFEALDDIFGFPDFSMGVAGQVLGAQAVPAPASLVLTALGLASLPVWSSTMKRRTRQRPGSARVFRGRRPDHDGDRDEHRGALAVRGAPPPARGLRALPRLPRSPRAVVRESAHCRHRGLRLQPD
jgi:hypothetical protein